MSVMKRNGRSEIKRIGNYPTRNTLSDLYITFGTLSDVKREITEYGKHTLFTATLKVQNGEEIVVRTLNASAMNAYTLGVDQLIVLTADPRYPNKWFINEPWTATTTQALISKE